MKRPGVCIYTDNVLPQSWTYDSDGSHSFHDVALAPNALYMVSGGFVDYFSLCFVSHKIRDFFLKFVLQMYDFTAVLYYNSTH